MERNALVRDLFEWGLEIAPYTKELFNERPYGESVKAVNSMPNGCTIWPECKNDPWKQPRMVAMIVLWNISMMQRNIVNKLVGLTLETLGL